MAGRYLDILGTVYAKFRLGLAGPFLKSEATNTTVAIRNAGDTDYATLKAMLASIVGNDIELKADAAGSGADWKMTIRRPATGMAEAKVFVLPAGSPSPGQALTVDPASTTSNIILAYTTVAAGTDKLVVDTTSIAFGTTSPAAMFTMPIGAIITLIEVIIDTAFDGAPTMSVGIAGTTSKYMPTTAVDLTAPASTSFEYSPNLPAVGSTEDLLLTYSAGSATAGAGRVLVHYVIPS